MITEVIGCRSRFFIGGTPAVSGNELTPPLRAILDLIRETTEIQEARK
jgi:hypothetical protein